jgi:hypothetical protein
MFSLTAADLASLGLTVGALADWYERKTGYPLEDSPIAKKLAAARLAVGGGVTEGVTPAPPRAPGAGVGGMKRLSDDGCAGGGENQAPGSGGAKRAAAVGPHAGSWRPALASPPPAGGSGGSGSAGGSPVPVLSAESERLFSEALRGATGRRGECSVRDLLAVLPTLDEKTVFDCLKVFELRNRVMVAVDRIFLI